MSTTMRESVSVPLDVATKLAYGVGALGDSIKTFSFTTFLLFYYTTVLGLPGTLLGLAMSVGLLWDAAIDPLIGHMSDRARFGFGRRHTFMLVGAVFMAGGFIAVFNPPSGLSTAVLFAWLMMSSLIVRSSNSLFMVPYYALGSELATEYHERTSLSGYRAGAVLAGTLLATIAAFVVFFPSSPVDGVDPKFVRGSYESMGLFFGLAMAAAGLGATFGTLHERRRIASSSHSPAGSDGIRRSIVGTLAHRPFRVLIGSSALSFMAMTINAALMLHFLTYHARVPATAPIGLSFGAFYVGALVGVFVWVRVCKWFEKHHLYAATVAVSAVVTSSGYWLVGEGRPLGTGNMSAVAVLTALVGFFGIAGAVVAPSMMADITADDERRTGRRRDGIFFGIYSFGQQFSSGLAVLIAGGLVDRFAGLVPGTAEQSAATSERLAMITSLLPAALLASASLLILKYDLTRAAVNRALPLGSGRSPTDARKAKVLDSDPI
jgi:glycoside/pentoside/hexuronide:cation symporter, GPH family